MDDIVCPLCIHFHPEVAGDHFVVAPCGHFYHNECIQKYLIRGKQRCPTCDSSMLTRKLTKLYGIDPNRKLSFSNPPIVTPTPAITKQPSHKETQSYIFKIALLGSSGVGKSCLLKRFAEDTFVPNINATRGVDLVRKNVQMGDVTVQLIIWDTIGQEIFNSITSTCVRDVQGILFVYDVSKVQTLKDLQYWINFAEDYGPKDTVKVLVGNQIDLKENRKISFQEGKAVADKNNFPFFETSAKLSDNVEATFRALTAKILENEWIMSAVQNRMSDVSTIRLRANDRFPPVSCCEERCSKAQDKFQRMVAVKVTFLRSLDRCGLAETQNRNKTLRKYFQI
ncbi:unnamed protein product [Allacma fusca]|uniref:RING-type domain-containing protein n=1 Tax=Allacma fusca TaxID=39272 RepID=A0A8J2J5J6_9HEXA|nr:unnamed protein product [Allacma fusca]